MSEQTASNDEDPSQSIPSDPSSTPGCDDTEPQDDQVSEKSLSSLEDYRSNSQESRIGTPTLEAITAINALSNGYSDGVSDTEDEYEYDDEGENEDQAGDGGDDTHGGPSSQQSFEIWSDGTYDSDRTGNGTDHEGNDQDDYQDGGQEQKDNDDDEREDKEYDEDEEDEEEHTTLIDSPRSEIGSQLPTPPPPSPNQPPSIASQQLPQYDTNPQSYLGPPPDQQPEQQDYELPPTHGLPQVHGLGRMGDPFLSNPLQDNQAYYGAGSDALYYPYPGQGQYDIRRDSEGNPVCSPLPPPAIPLPPLPAGESFLGHGPTRQYQDQCQYQYRYQYEDQYENQYQDQHQDQNHDPNGLPQLDESRHSASTEYENGVPVGGGSGREAYPGLVLQSTEGPNDQHGVGGTRSNPISLSSGDNGEPARRGSHPETAITISTGSSDNGSRPETAIAASSGSSDSGDSGPAPGGGTSGQGHDGEDDRTPEGSATGQEQYEGSDPAPASDQNASDAASTGSSQNEREHVSLWAQVSPVYGTSLSGTDGETLDESVTQGYYYMDSDSEEQQEQEQTRPYGPTSPTLSPSPERQPAGQDETGSSYPEPTYTGYPVIPGVAEHYNPYLNSIYPYSPTQPTLPNTGQDFGPDLEPNTQEYYGYFPEGYYEQHNEEPQQPSEHTPEEQALYENLTDQNRLNAPIALARDIVDVMRDMINSSSNSRHSSPRYSPVVTPSQDRSAPAIPVPISFSTHYHRFFEAETGSAPASFTGPPRTYTYVPALSEFPGVAERSVPSVSEGEDEAEVGPPPPPLHTPVSVPTIIEPRRLSTPEIDTGFETERLPSTPTPIPRPVLLRSLGICESPARLSRSPTPVSPRTINIGPRQVPEVPEERESAPELKAESEPEPEPEPKLKSESLSDTEPGQNETPQTNRESESVQVKPESEADTALETIPEYESAPESQPSTRAPSDAGSEYKPGPEADTDSDSEAELGNNQQLVADELGDGVHEQTQEQKQELEKGSGENSKNGSDETEYHSSRESAPSPSPYQTPPPRNPSPPPRRITRAYARQLQQGQQTSTKTSEQAEQGPSKTKEGKGKRKARELTPSPPRGTKRKESSSPSPPPSPPKRRATRSQTLQQEPKKADSGSGKGKRKAKATTSKGTKRRAESPSPPENQGPVSKKRRVTEAETEEAYPEQPALRLRSNPRVATRADQRERLSPLIVNNPPTAIRSVYVFGANSHGQLGLGHAEANVTQPTLNTNLTKDTVGVVDLAAGGHHCVALTHDNRILTWGDNSDGQLGRETQAQQEPTPMEVDFTELGLPADTVFVQVTATESATFVLTEFGDVYGWGTFRETYTNEADEEVSILIGFRPSVTFQRTPLHIPELKYVKKLASGAQHVLALSLTEDADLVKSKSSNRRASTVPNRITKSRFLKSKRGMPKPENAVFAWGAYKRDQLGRRILGRQRTAATAGLTPRLVALPGKTKCDVASIGAGAYHSFAVKGDGYVYAWGYNRYGQTGVVDDVDLLQGDSTVPVPTGLDGLGLGSLEPDREYILTGGRDHSLAVTEDGRCLSWGSIGGNSLGVRQDMLSEDDLLFEDGSETPSILTRPTVVSGVESRVEKASAGWGHSILVSKSGAAYAWGSNGEYEVKQPRSVGVELPRAVQTSPLRGLRVVDAAAGRQFSGLLVE